MTMRMCAFTDPSDIAWQLLCFLDHHDSVLECVSARRMPELRAEVRAGRNCRLYTMALVVVRDEWTGDHDGCS